MKDLKIDNGKSFDFGSVSSIYARYRDIYTAEFYKHIENLGVGIKGQKCLDVGTGTGVLPRNLYGFGADWTGTDISENQIEQAKKLSLGKKIDYYVCPAENVDKLGKFDLITACQCLIYFNHEKCAETFYNALNAGGKVMVAYMAWLPMEDEIANATEKLILKYNPNWSGKNEKMRPIEIPYCYERHFKKTYNKEFLLDVPFTRESWNGRIISCRGIGASLPENKVKEFEKEHIALLNGIASSEFYVKHYAAFSILERKD